MSVAGRDATAALASLASPNRNTTMHDRNPEPNAELKTRFEPLRVLFALGALLLGLVAALQGG